MKHLITLILLTGLLFTSCSNENQNFIDELTNTNVDNSAISANQLRGNWVPKTWRNIGLGYKFYLTKKGKYRCVSTVKSWAFGKRTNTGYRKSYRVVNGNKLQFKLDGGRKFFTWTTFTIRRGVLRVNNGRTFVRG